MEDSIKLSFEYSKSLEQERIVNTIKRIPWYTKNGYSTSSLAFPKSFDQNKLEDISQEDVLSAVNAEYDETKFISTEASMRKLFDPYEVRLVQFLKELKLPIISDVVIQMTIYGMAGSYSAPNKVIVNISKFFNIGLLRNILHEIIHLHIQHLIDTYKIDQWQKETIVNLLFQKVYSDLYKENKIPIDTTKIEAIYKENFPDIEKIIASI